MKITRLLALGIALTACKAETSDNSSSVKTDLGAAGNAKLKQDFDAYVGKGSGCGSPGTDKRVIVTGFGPFDTSGFNISGKVVESMASTSFWSADVTGYAATAVTSEDAGAEGQATGAQAQPEDGNIAAGDFGGKTSRRTIKVDGNSYDACLIVLDVKWDLASAIILHEAATFRPDMIIMTGRGGSGIIFEGGAINEANGSTGFDSSGASTADNKPVAAGTPLLESKPKKADGTPDLVRMTWDNDSFVAPATEAVKGLGYAVSRETSARPSNNYICNNTSYLVLYGVRGEELSLGAGSLVSKMETPLGSADSATPKVGFLHLPNDAAAGDREKVTAFMNMIAVTIKAQLN